MLSLEESNSSPPKKIHKPPLEFSGTCTPFRLLENVDVVHHDCVVVRLTMSISKVNQSEANRPAITGNSYHCHPKLQFYLTSR